MHSKYSSEPIINTKTKCVKKHIHLKQIIREGDWLLFRPKIALYYKKAKTLTVVVSVRPADRGSARYAGDGYLIWDGRWGKLRIFSGWLQHADFNFEVRWTRRGLNIGHRDDRPMLRSVTLHYAVVLQEMLASAGNRLHHSFWLWGRLTSSEVEPPNAINVQYTA